MTLPARHRSPSKRRWSLLLLVGVFSFSACDTPSERAKKLPKSRVKKAVDKVKKQVKQYADKVEKLSKPQ